MDLVCCMNGCRNVTVVMVVGKTRRKKKCKKIVSKLEQLSISLRRREAFCNEKQIFFSFRMDRQIQLRMLAQSTAWLFSALLLKSKLFTAVNLDCTIYFNATHRISLDGDKNWSRYVLYPGSELITRQQEVANRKKIDYNFKCGYASPSKLYFPRKWITLNNRAQLVIKQRRLLAVTSQQYSERIARPQLQLNRGSYINRH